MNDDAIPREGYRAALQLVSQDAKSIWDSFRSILAANTVLIGLAGAVLKFYPDSSPLARILGIAGLVICIVWTLINMRLFAFYNFYFAWARKYERDGLGSDDHVVQNGRQFAEGATVNVWIGAVTYGVAESCSEN